MRQLSIHSITVKGQAIYQCSTCGAFGSGDSITVKVISPKDIAEIKPGPSAMPIGWSSHSGDDGRGDYLTFRCPNCKPTLSSKLSYTPVRPSLVT
jgi:DNA-directed RNA polymerase subunit RPC12/RpoP